MQECLKKLIESGVCVGDFSRAYADLLDLNHKTSRSSDALIAFAKQYRASPIQIERAVETLFSPLPDSFRVCLTPSAKEVLAFFHSLCPMAIVTGGNPPLQWDKLKKAGIDRSLFSMIGIPEDSVKKPYYQALQAKWGLPSKEIWVCGDRIEVDLRPAFDLGFRTVHMRWGRGARLTPEKWIDYSISNLSELKEIVR